MNIRVEEKHLDEIHADCEIILVIEGQMLHRWIHDKPELDALGFDGKSESCAILAAQKRIYVGAESFDKDEIRLAIATAIKALQKTTFHTFKMGSYVKTCPATYLKAQAEGALLGSYRFDRYKSQQEQKSDSTLIISLEEYHDKALKLESIQSAVDEAVAIALATNLAKDIVNAVPDDMTPALLADQAQRIADTFENVSCFVGDESFLQEQKMGAFMAVARASIHPPRFIHLTYKPQNATEKYVFVGKGLTYDSGGLSLKPSEHMVSMKADKSGAAAALGILQGAAAMNLPFEVHAIIGSCENMIGGNAYKPDDILVAKNGITIEVRNTDAEGRLVLADCLCYASALKPDALFDLATLTGACVVAVGEYTTGIMGHSSKLKHEMLTAASKSGELAGTLPFNRYLKKLIKSDIADISNISSSRYGGAITAGLFLDHFVSDTMKDKWLHLDIAGPAFIEKDWGYNQSGASGAGVRMALYWLKAQINKENHYHDNKEQ
jgi:leucyl aminopeptidase